MVHQDVAPRPVDLEVDDGRAARRYGDGLHPCDRHGSEAGAFVDVVEYLADDVEGGGEVRPADAKKYAHRLARTRPQRMRLCECAHRAVEEKVLRPLGDQLFVVHLLMSRHPEALGGVEFSLHDIEFAVHLRQAAFRLHQDQSIHAVGDVMRHAGRGAVINEQTRNKRFERDHLLLSRLGLREFGAAARTGGGVEIDRVIHEAGLVVLEMDLNRVADAHADEGARHLAVECPEIVGDLIVQLPLELDRLQVDPDDLWWTGANGRRQIGRIAHDLRSYRGDGGPRPRGHLDAAFHPGLAMARDRAEVDELTGLVGLERERAACAYS